MRGRLAATALLAVVLVSAGSPAAHADTPVVTWDATAVTVEYGEYWQLSATVTNAPQILGPWTASGTMSGTPSGYTPQISAFQSGPEVVVAYVAPPASGRPLGAGSYAATLAVTEEAPGSPSYSASGPATVTITPAALATTLQVIADPSNPANAIISGELTGTFRQNFFTASYPDGPLGPAGTWKITATDENGDVVHEASVERPETSDMMGVSDYWSDVPPGTYAIRAVFTSSGPAAGNFAITAPDPVTYTAAPAPGATSTATPAPPAPPPTPGDSGMTLPGWIPLIAGILSAGLLALMILQIVRLRRAATPTAPDAPAGAA